MCCSVVFGVTLRLLVINISSSCLLLLTSPLTTSDSVTTCRTVVRWRRIDNTWPVAALTASSEARYIGSESQFLPTTPAFDAPVKRVPVGISPCRLVYGKTRIMWLPDGEKKFEDMLIRFDRMYERDRHTDRHTPHDGIGRACKVSRDEILPSYPQTISVFHRRGGEK